MSLGIALFSFLVSAIALGWNIYRDCVDRPKIKIKAYIATSTPLQHTSSADLISQIFQISEPLNINMEAVREITDQINTSTEILYVEVTNIGKKPIIIRGHEFQLDNKNMVMPILMEQFHNKKLEPYERLQVAFPNEILGELSKIAKQIQAFCIYDTHGKKWKLANEDLVKLKKDLLS